MQSANRPRHQPVLDRAPSTPAVARAKSSRAHRTQENGIGCSGVGEAVVWQVREPWTERQHDKADGMLYVVGGEGTLRLDGKDVSIAAGSFAVVPRGMGYGLTRRGRNPLIVLAVLAGAPCTGN